MPRLNLVAGNAHAAEQQFQVILRVGEGIAATKWRAVFVACNSGSPERLPNLIVKRQIEIGQDHRAARQFRNASQQLGQRGRCAGYASRDNRIVRRVFLPAPRGVFKQHVAPCGGINLAFRFAFIPPFQLHTREGVDASPPVLGRIADHIKHAFLH